MSRRVFSWAAISAAFSFLSGKGGGGKVAAQKGGGGLKPISPLPLNPPPKVGGYLWDTGLGQEGDRLTPGIQQVKTLSPQMGAIRVPLGFAQPRTFGFEPDPFAIGQQGYLVATASHPAFQALFADPQFTDIMLTTYTPAAYAKEWAFTTMDFQKERDEYAQLAYYLGNMFPGKKFYLSNWESQNELANNYARELNYHSYVQARLSGIRDAAVPNVWGVVEVNCPGDGDGFPCDNAIVLERLGLWNPDYISYSCWRTINRYRQSNDPAGLQLALEMDIDRIVGYAGPAFWGGKIIIGEFGREQSCPIPAEQWFAAVWRAARAKRVPLMFYWRTTMDAQVERYGLFDESGGITENGLALRGIL